MSGIAGVVLACVGPAVGQPVRISSTDRPLFGARATAMGNASGSEATDVLAMYANPAALAYLENFGVAMSAILDWHSQSLIHSIAIPIQLNSDETVAIGISGSHDGERWASPQFTVYGVDIAAAQELTTSLSLGAIAQIRHASTTSSALWATNGSVGSFYSPSGDVSYSLVFNNLGWGVDYDSENPPHYLTYEKSPQKNVEISASYRFPLSTREPTLRLCFASQKFSGSSVLTYKAGVEIRVVNDLTLRFGDVSAPPLNFLNFGFGLALGHLSVDYAIAPSIASGQYHQLSVVLPFTIGLVRR